MPMTKNEIEKAIEYLNIKGTLSGDFKGFSLLYSMTTENISGFINQYDLRNKRVLTVAGSGDQRYNCLLRGASEVVLFDVNPLVDLHLRLKETAVKVLSHDDFLRFFGVRKDKKDISFLDKDIFNKLKNYLDKDVYLFYYYVINEFRGQVFKRVYNEFDYRYSHMTVLSNYISKDNYKKIPEIIDGKKISFLNSNISTLPDELYGEKFDMILLSNISDYVHYFYGDDHMKEFKEVIDRLVDNLHDGGIMEVGYIYQEYDKKHEKDFSKFRIDKSRDKVFSKEEYPVQDILGFYEKEPHDRIVTYQKKL